MLLEVIKILVSLVTPVIIAIFAYSLNKRLKSIDNAQWQNRKIIEKRLAIYDDIAPDLNLVFCFCHFLGYWKDITPKQMLDTKRRLDKNVNIYRHLLSEHFFHAYEQFVHTAFRTYTGHGKDALIRSAITNNWGNRKEHTNYEWISAFDSMFDIIDLPSDKELAAAYLNAMTSLRDCMGLKGDKL